MSYIRTSTDKQDLKNQKLEIYEYARTQNLTIDRFIEISVSSRKTVKQRRIEELVDKLEFQDTLIVTELSRLGRSTTEILTLIHQFIQKSIRLIVIKQKLDLTQHDMNSKVMITLFSLFAELERDLVSLRTKEALAVKKSLGIKLGKPKGTIQKSKFDLHKDKISELLILGLSVRKISRFLGYTNHIALNTYVNKRDIRVAAP